MDGVNLPQQLNSYLVGKCIVTHHEDLKVYDIIDINFASPNKCRLLNAYILRILNGSVNEKEACLQ